MYANNNLYFVGNLVTEIYFFQEVIIYLCLVEKSVFLANSPYFPFSSIIPFVRLTRLCKDKIYYKMNLDVKNIYPYNLISLFKKVRLEKRKYNSWIKIHEGLKMDEDCLIENANITQITALLFF